MDNKTVVFSSESIAKRVEELGAVISHDFTGCDLVVVGILSGAFIFIADLVRKITIPHAVDFVRVASYGQGRSSSGTITLSKDMEIPITGRHVLLVEDIVDSGRTLDYLKKLFMTRGPRSVRTCVLVNKRERREIPMEIDYMGFDLAAGFLVGYGMDCAEQYRHYPEVCRLDDAS